MSDSSISLIWAHIFVAMKSGAILQRQPGARFYIKDVVLEDKYSCQGLPADFVELQARPNGCLLKIDNDTCVLKGAEQPEVMGFQAVQGSLF